MKKYKVTYKYRTLGSTTSGITQGSRTVEANSAEDAKKEIIKYINQREGTRREIVIVNVEEI
ncbi:hypothetical protein [Avibacterium paragallinarum]|uniref:Uncharacterized protein n=1 Tax=Avibacterium paragallinarum TaxID=728 RepID=A0ABU7QLK9_AVIPA|nr:hypothetical protein [Avibacterium paragallinarum]QZP15565.1 hypothetical protein K5O18_12550 [Avibacterium paragallinarum]QZP16156.1 hypothetical protein K5O18_01975 [Avibacterium paragallinarum]WAL56789.1 hypothetical protein OY678_12925 [Avibacterium paragallinarum]WAM59336.1 hypothetical protein OW731_12745 [Avibacterium paragallinarum]